MSRAIVALVGVAAAALLYGGRAHATPPQQGASRSMGRKPASVAVLPVDVGFEWATLAHPSGRGGEAEPRLALSAAWGLGGRAFPLFLRPTLVLPLPRSAGTPELRTTTWLPRARATFGVGHAMGGSVWRFAVAGAAYAEAGAGFTARRVFDAESLFFAADLQAGLEGEIALGLRNVDVVWRVGAGNWPVAWRTGLSVRWSVPLLS